MIKSRRDDAGPSNEGGVDYSWRIYRQSAGPGYFLLGDAAVLVDPATSNGVLRAMMSGILAVDLVRRMMDGRMDEQSAAGEYVEWIARTFQYYMSTVGSQYPLSRAGAPPN
jgi:flavin-dependent dehydrogenase